MSNDQISAFRPRTLPELVRHRAGERPEDVVYTFLADGEEDEQRLTYAALDRRARAAAAGLQGLGASGERVLLLYPPGLDYIVAFLGCLYAGATAVPAYPPRPNRPMPRLLAIRASAQARFALAPGALLPRLAEQLGPELRLATLEDLSVAGADAWRDPGLGEETLAFLQYTSGSTAEPKGVMLDHGNLLHNLGLIRDGFALTPEDRAFFWLPPYHDMGLIGGLLEPLHAGYPVTLAAPVTFLQRPLRWLRAITRFGITVSGGPNFAYELCLTQIPEEQRGGLDLSSWQVAFNGAEPVRAATLDRFAAAFGPYGFRREAFMPCYGLAEATLLVATGRRGAGPDVRCFSAGALERHRVEAAPAGEGGRAFVGSGANQPGQEIAVVDPGSGVPCAPGEVGEIWVRGLSVARGYWNQPDLTAATFGARLAGTGEGTYLRTGDLGFLDVLEGGELFVTGRLKDLIILRGRNHYPQDLEATAEVSHPALRRGHGAAFAVDVEGEERLVVVQEVERSQRRGDLGETVAAVRRALTEEHEVQPFAVSLLPPGALPRTSSGKVRRHAARAAFLDGSLEAVWEWRETEPERAELEEESAARPADWLAAELARRSRLPRAGIDAQRPLGEYPLDSLQVVQLLHAVEARWGYSLPLERFFEGLTLAELARLLEEPAAAPPESGPRRAGPEHGDHPLASNQQSLWFLHRLDPASPAYNVPTAVRLRGPVDSGALRRSFQALVDRHPALRSTFPLVAGEPRQRVAEHAEVCFAEEDAAGWSEGALRGRLEEEARRPFDLAAGPLLRVVLFHRGAGEAVLLVAFHHIVIDLWSLGLLLEELGSLYPAFAAGGSPALPKPALAYTDAVAWQRERLAGPGGEGLWAYWRERLAGELPTLSLRTDRPRPPVQTTRGATVSRVLDAGLSARLQEIGRRRRCTPFITLTAAFEVLLHRWTGDRDLLLGTVSHGRSDAALAPVVGYFVDALVLRAGFAGDPSFADFLEAARQDAVGAFEHQGLPFPLLVERLQPERDPGRSPLFQVLAVWQRAELADGQDLTGFALGVPAAVELGGLRMESFPLDLGLAQFDLTLSLGEVGGSLIALFDYNTDLFDAATAHRLAERYVILLEGIAADPAERPLSALPLLNPAEAQQLLVELNDTAAGFPREATLADLVAEQAESTPEALAVACGEETLTYRELTTRAERLAHRLAALGVGPEELVAVCCERSADLVVACLGVLAAGAAYLPLDPEEPAERLAAILADAGARRVLSREELRPRLPAGVEVHCLERMEPATGETALRPSRQAGGANLACAIYTSGSTGRPKGVLLPHRALVNLVGSFLASYRPGSEDRILPLTSIAHASFLGELYPLLCAGGAVVLPRRHELLEREARLDLIRRHRVTILSTVPSMAADLNALRGELPHVRLLLVGGEALAAADVDRLLATAEIVNGYGLTETAVCSTIHRLRPADLAGRRLPIGRPVRNTRVYVLDRGLRLLPAGAAGELFVAGEGLARGYLEDPARTAERFLPDPFARGERMYRTGDLGLWRPAGDLESLGRVDQQVKVRGFRIEPEEIEAVLARHPRVRDSAVALHRDSGGGPRLAAWVVPEGPDLAAGELLAYLRERLPEPMVPSAVVFLDALPTGPTGKLDASRLPAPPAPGSGAGAGSGVPRSSLERRIAEVWQEALGVAAVGIHDNFFDLGGHSLLLTKVHARLQEVLRRELSLVDLFQYPTVSSLAESLAGGGAESSARPERRAERGAGGGREIAIIGMAGRFPGAASVPELWRNVTAGVESIRRFTNEELLAAGTDPALVANPSYVKAKGILGDVDLFDAQFFGLNPREVELMDPQHRIFLECCWEALERAAWDPERFPGSVGVFAGESMNTYMLMNLLPHMELVASADTLQASLGNDKDPLTSRVAYKLNLKGPTLTVQTASSTSLAAVHTACRFLLQGDCDMALAGGVSIHLPEVSGYMFEEGGTTSRDGHCRAFDAKATGFVSGHGAGVVVLKRLADAVADGDHIHAVIKGSACNNDGSLKVSFMAPSVDGQREVYARAYEDAGVSPETVGYVECHGTGTALGDPIEIAALTRVFAAHTERKGFCAIGSLKTNIGHLDTAAGVSGLIKASLALEHRILPASLHFESPNPQIDFANSPFAVNAVTRPWEVEAGPRRAGVTSLGMGGTNVHMVLEEPPPLPATTPSRPWQLFLLSARSPKALDLLTLRLADHLEAHPGLCPADVAWSLQVGRKPMPYRRMLLAASREEAVDRLATLDPEHVLTDLAPPGDRPVAFLLSGQGTQYPNMGRGLYDAEPSFRDDLDLCCRLLLPHLGLDLREVLFVEPDREAEAAERLQQTALAQPALFVIAYATARQWMAWGVRPSALLGHSLGEYVAACLAGVISLEDALALVALRGTLMQRMPPGAMLAVPLREEEVQPLLGEELALAAVNGPAACVVSGPAAAVEALRAQLEEQGLTCRRLHTSHAFHSAMMDPVLAPFRERLRKARLAPPRIPYLSNVTGTWIRPEEAVDPEHWVRQIRQAVRFADGVAALLAEPRRILLEVGPGDALATLARRHPARGPEHAVLSSLRHAKDPEPDQRFLLNALGRLWMAGGAVSWERFYAGERRRRVPLPTYPFERRRYWVEPGDGARKAGAQETRRREPEDWFWVPGWKQAVPPGVPWGGAAAASPASWLVFLDGCGLGAQLVERLEAAGHRVATVLAGSRFQRLGPQAFEIAPGREEDYELLLSALGERPARALHLWNVTGEAPAPGAAAGLDLSYASLVGFAQALAKQGDAPLSLGVVSDGVHAVTGEERLEPLKAALLGPCGVLPRELPWLSCRSIDVWLGPEGAPRAADQILAEMECTPLEPVVAWRRHLRWVRSFEPVPLPAAPAGMLPPRLRQHGVYLITGGLGGLGLALARHLAREAQARLVLVGRSPLPERDLWEGWIEAHGEEDRTSRRLRCLEALEALGSEVLVVAADVADRERMREVRRMAEERFGAVHGVIHAAGVAGVGMIQGKTREAAARVLAPKVDGTLALAEAFAGARLDFLVLFSSITAALPEIGQTDYVAANSFLDAFALRARQSGDPVVAIGWDAWRESGMAVETAVPRELEAWRRESLAQGLDDAEGAEAFSRVLASGLPQVLVSTVSFAARLAANARSASLDELAETEAPATFHPRPLATPYVPPEGEPEQQIAEIWREILGVDKVGALDNFFELGGNSLAGIRVTRRLRERHAVDLPDVSLYEAPTVRALARLLAPQPAEPVEADEGRGRGDRRRERLAQRRSMNRGEEP